MSQEQNMPQQQHELSYVAPGMTNPMVTERAVQLLGQTSLWVRIMSILIFVGAGFMVLAGCIVTAGGIITPRAGDPSAGPRAAIGIFYIVLSLLYIAPAVFLWRYASHAKAFSIDRHENNLEEALQAQKSFWKFVAIMALVIIGFELISIPIFLGIMMMHR